MEALGTVIVVAVAVVQTVVEFSILGLESVRSGLEDLADIGARLRDRKR